MTARCRPPFPTTTRMTATLEARTTALTEEAVAPPVRGLGPEGKDRFQEGRSEVTESTFFFFSQLIFVATV